MSILVRGVVINAVIALYKPYAIAIAPQTIAKPKTNIYSNSKKSSPITFHARNSLRFSRNPYKVSAVLFNSPKAISKVFMTSLKKTVVYT